MAAGLGWVRELACASREVGGREQGRGSVLTLGPDSNLINATARGHWTLDTAP